MRAAEQFFQVFTKTTSRRPPLLGGVTRRAGAATSSTVARRGGTSALVTNAVQTETITDVEQRETEYRNDKRRDGADGAQIPDESENDGYRGTGQRRESDADSNPRPRTEHTRRISGPGTADDVVIPPGSNTTHREKPNFFFTHFLNVSTSRQEINCYSILTRVWKL